MGFCHLPDLRVAHAEIAQAIGIALNAAHPLLVHSTRYACRGSPEPGSYRQGLADVGGRELLVFFDQFTDRVVVGLPDNPSEPAVIR